MPSSGAPIGAEQFYLRHDSHSSQVRNLLVRIDTETEIEARGYALRIPNLIISIMTPVRMKITLALNMSHILHWSICYAVAILNSNNITVKQYINDWILGPQTRCFNILLGSITESISVKSLKMYIVTWSLLEAHIWTEFSEALLHNVTHCSTALPLPSSKSRFLSF